LLLKHGSFSPSESKLTDGGRGFAASGFGLL